MMPTSFLDLPLELRDEIYKLIIPLERGTHGEPFTLNTDTIYCSGGCPFPSPFDKHLDLDMPFPAALAEALRTGAKLLRTCSQVNKEAASYVYGQQLYLFSRPQQALEWLDCIGQYQGHLRNVAITGYFVPHEALRVERQTQAHMWASVLRKLPNITTLSCLTCLHVMRGKANDWSSTVWNDEAVLEAIRGLAHVRVLLIEGAQRADGAGRGVLESSLELTLDKPFLETLVINGHPITGAKWYPEDYFDRLIALKHLTIASGLRMQSGNSKVSSKFFSHVAPLRSFTWYGRYLTSSYRKVFTTHHGGTLQFLKLVISLRYCVDEAAQRSEESACVESLTNIFRALPVLKILSLTYNYDCARLIENMPRSLTVLSLNGGAYTRGYPNIVYPSLVQDKSLCHALRKLPDRCPKLAHVRLEMYQRVEDEDHMGRCGMLSIRNHAALEYVSSKIKDTFVASCVARGCSETVPMDPDSTNKILWSWHRFFSQPVSKIDLNDPWQNYRAALESVTNKRQ